VITSTQHVSGPLKWLTGLILVGILAACGGSDNDSPTSVATTSGIVKGAEEETMLTFKGIPYAAPPVGELRWQPPQPIQPSWPPIQATEFKGPCIQPASTFGASESTEDCLYLNVYTPKEEGNYPVMVWIHGGSLETGSGGASYDPVRLVERGMVVVTINYRLGILGFLAHPDLRQASSDGSGNYGIMDQQAALQWVETNIANFNGNPDNVTIFGESAGGHSVLTHLVSPESEGLFDRVIVQSGSYSPDQRTLEQAESWGSGIVADLGCDTADDIASCLRAVPAEDIIAAQQANDYSFVPNERPDILPRTIADGLSSGDFAEVPIMMGTNLDEWRLFVTIQTLTRAASGDGTPLLEASEYEAAIQADLGVPAAVASTIAGEYPISDYGTDADAPSLAQAAVGTDAIFACNGLSQASSTAAAGASVYAYEFADRDAPNILGTNPGFDTGAAHAFEIQYVLASEAALTARGMTADQITLANHMADYWTRFARNGDPNSSDGTGTNWPSFGTTGELLSLDAPTPSTITSTAFSTEHHCSFWASLL
jgi:para-nitrobenzyl esterase